MEENKSRLLVHVGMAGFALLIGRLSPIMISLAALTALVFNLFFLPRLSRNRLSRHHDGSKGSDKGLLLYPASLTLVSLLFFDQQIFMAVAWGAMAFGDAAANFVGRRIPGPCWPWNPQKSILGSLAFVFIGVGLTLALVYFLPRSQRLGLGLGQWLLIILIALPVSALVESLPYLVDDNLSVPLSAGLVAYFTKEAMLYGSLFFPSNVWLGLFLTFAFAAISWATGKIDISGSITGGLIAFAIFLGGGLAALAMLGIFFVGGTAASMWGRRRKKAEGLAQENEGKRSINNALANGLIPALSALLAWIFPLHRELFMTAVMASLAAATGDTLASELGNLYGRRYINILTFKPDRRGLDGAISLEGSLAGLLGAIAIVLAYGILEGTWVRGSAMAVAAGFLGVMFDSALGASLQRKGLLNNDTVNFAMTLFSATLGGLLFYGLY